MDLLATAAANSASKDDDDDSASPTPRRRSNRARGQKRSTDNVGNDKQQTKKTRRQDEKKKPAAKNQKATKKDKKPTKAQEERKKRKEERIATQNRLAAQERERKKKVAEAKQAQKKAEAEKIAERRAFTKQRQEQILADKLKTVAHVASLQQVDAETYSDVMNKATEAAAEAAGKEEAHVANEKVGSGPTENDVLLGRGGMTNQHPGNKRFRDIVLRVQPTYINLRSRVTKSQISKSIVEQVQKSGGRFLKEFGGEWKEVTKDVAQKKASQALRENAKEIRQLQAISATNNEAKKVPADPDK